MPEIAIGLALGDGPVASQAFGHLGQWRMRAQEGTRLIESLGLLSIAGACHETYMYVYLCHKSRDFSCSPTLLPVANCTFKLEVIFCVQTVITAPWGVPASGVQSFISSSTPWVRNASTSFS